MYKKNEIHHGWKLRSLMILILMLLPLVEATILYQKTKSLGTEDTELLLIIYIIIIFVLSSLMVITVFCIKKYWWRIGGFKTESYICVVASDCLHHDGKYFIYIENPHGSDLIRLSVSKKIYDYISKERDPTQKTYIKIQKHSASISKDSHDSNVVLLDR